MEEWTDRKELDRINCVFDEEQEELKDTIYHINKMVPSVKLGNIGLYSGNKMRSMYRRYKEQNVQYFDSKVNRAIEVYFMFQFDNAVYALKRFSAKLQATFEPTVKQKILNEFVLTSPDIKDYKDICEEVYNFDLDKDVVEAIDYVLDNSPIILGFGMNEIIDEYNEELIKLGVPNKVEHREIDFSAIEIPEEELVFLKLIFDEISKQLTNDKSADTNNETDIYKTITKKEKE